MKSINWKFVRNELWTFFGNWIIQLLSAVVGFAALIATVQTSAPSSDRWAAGAMAMMLLIAILNALSMICNWWANYIVGRAASRE